MAVSDIRFHVMLCKTGPFTGLSRSFSGHASISPKCQLRNPLREAMREKVPLAAIPGHAPSAKSCN